MAPVMTSSAACRIAQPTTTDPGTKPIRKAAMLVRTTAR